MSASDLHPLNTPRRSALVPGLVFLLAIATLVWVGRERVSTNGLFPNIDYSAYHLAGLKVRLGLAREILYPHPAADGRPASFIRVDPADIDAINRRLPERLHLSHETGAYLYPPLIAVLVAPLTVFPIGVAGVAWRGFLLLAAGAGVWGLRTTLVRRMGVGPITAWVVVLAMVTTWPLLYSIRLGQASALLFASVAITVWALSERRLGLAGVAVGCGALLKLLPALLVVLFIGRPTRRAGWAALATLAIGTIVTSLFVSPFDFLRFFRGMSLNLHEAAGRVNDQSLISMFVHLLVSPEDRMRMAVDPAVLTPGLRLIGNLASALLGLGAIAACLRPARRRAHADPDSMALPSDAALLAVVAVAVTPVALSHLFATALPAYALALGGRFARGRRPGTLEWLGVAALQALWLIPPVSFPDSFGHGLIERLLLNTTLFAALVSGWLAWRVTRARPA